MSESLHVGLLYGGRSSEHDVSVRSARNVRAALAERHRVTPIYLARDGRWLVGDGSHLGEGTGGGTPATFTPHGGARTVAALDALGLDVVFPVLHGTGGEDGTVQGFLHTLGLPYVGPDVLASAACMDKAATKTMLEAAGLPGTPYTVVRAGDERPSFEALRETLELPFFVKPANSGSSVGITRVTAADGLEAAFETAFGYDRTVLVEEGVAGREIEVAVMGNERPEASLPGEIVVTADYYDYDAKYEDEGASRMEVPADLPEATVERVREMAVRAYRALGCEGLARVDFFVTESGGLLVNEINTIPGFTARSMYPVMWERTGRPFPEVCDRLLALAIDRHQRDAALRTDR